MQRFKNALQLLVACVALSGCAHFHHADLADAGDLPPDLPERKSNHGAIYQEGYDLPLFENSVAHRVGDLVTVRLVESTDATKSSSTSTKKSTAAKLPGPTIAGRPITLNGTEILAASLANDTKFEGAGTSKQSNSLQGDVTVTVVKRLANGYLVIRGEKWITINQGREFVRLSGIIRAIDIDPNNSIASSKVANARISYAGKGSLADANSPGLLARFFNSPRMPF